LHGILDAITVGAQELLRYDVVILRMTNPTDPESVLLVSSTGFDRRLNRRTWKATAAENADSELAEGDGIALGVVNAGNPDGATEPELRSVVAAPVNEAGHVVGSLVAASYKPDRVHTKAEQDALQIFADHASLAVTDAKMHQTMREAFRDSLTGLATRALFMDQLANDLAVAAHEQSGLAVFFVDLDRFKSINDSLGHAAGDALLVAVAARLRSCIRPDDTAARLGGDEFALVLRDGDVAKAKAVAARIIAALREPVALNGHKICVSASIGIALNAEFETKGDTLLRNADLAMYQAKKHGCARYEIYQPAMQQTVGMRSTDLEPQLRRAVERDELIVQYQPVVGLADREIVGLEALVRWPQHGRGLLLPSQFIPLAEQSGLVVAIDRLVLRQACFNLGRWNASRHGLPPLTMSVNVAASHLPHMDLREVASLISEAELQPNCLILEVTEAPLLADAPGTMERLQKLKALSARLSIDDFGAGYSSLTCLRRFPIDAIKIDRSLVKDVASDLDAAAFVGAIVQIGRKMSLDVIAKGIEFTDQVVALSEAGCSYGQGYYFAPPMDAHEVARMLAIDPTDTSTDASSVTRAAVEVAGP
jgi:diguanylate cyclase (GGDEF)-like protein